MPLPSGCGRGVVINPPEEPPPGYSAAYCPDSKVEDTARNREIVNAFAAENVVIAEVGAWKNMMDPDADMRRENRQYVAQRMALAEAVSARCCVDIAGSYKPGVLVRTARQESQPGVLRRYGRELPQRDRCGETRRTRFTIEMMGCSVPDGS